MRTHHTFKCKQCDIVFESRFKKARFCSIACVANHHRKYKKVKDDRFVMLNNTPYTLSDPSICLEIERNTFLVDGDTIIGYKS